MYERVNGGYFANVGTHGSQIQEAALLLYCTAHANMFFPRARAFGRNSFNSGGASAVIFKSEPQKLPFFQPRLSILIGKTTTPFRTYSLFTTSSSQIYILAVSRSGP